MQSNLRMTTIASCWSLPVVTLTEQNLQSPGRWVYEHVCKRFSWLGYLMWEDILRTFPFRGNKLSAITHCSLGLDSGCNVTIFLSSWCLGFPTMMEEYLELWAKTNLSLLSCLCQNILSQQQKKRLKPTLSESFITILTYHYLISLRILLISLLYRRRDWTSKPRLMLWFPEFKVHGLLTWCYAQYKIIIIATHYPKPSI